MANVWQDLPKPILILAPMEDVTDTVFRQIVAECARPDVFFTEFTSADGIVSRGRDIVMQRFKYRSEEHPIIAQIWGKNPQTLHEAARVIAEMGFDGIDFNTGCPDRSVVKHGCGSALIGETALVQELVGAIKEGAPGVPLSIKTRIGQTQIITDEWVPFLLTLPIDALTIHGRTAKEQSAVPAHWDEIGKAVSLRNALQSSCLIIGNGDVKDAAAAQQKVDTYGVDGVMIGRGIFQNLWAFRRTGDVPMLPLRDMLLKLRHHVELFDSTWGTSKNYAVMKKYFKIYTFGFDHATDLRDALMHTDTAAQTLELVDTLLAQEGAMPHVIQQSS